MSYRRPPMIVETSQLPDHAGQVTMVDGGFDPIHAGHVAYFRAAAELGMPVLCNVSSDEWVGRKHPPLLPQEQRVAVIDAFRDVAFTHLSSLPSVEVLELLRPKIYAKGDDWEGRLPQEELDACERLGIELVYLDTKLDSSTALLDRWHGAQHDAKHAEGRA